MKFFVAGKVGADEHSVGGAIARLQALGHEVPYDWRDEAVATPYREHPENGVVANRMIAAVHDCDAVLIVWHDRLLGGILEAGMAIALRKHLFILKPADGNVRDSLYWNRATIVDDLGELPV